MAKEAVILLLSLFFPPVAHQITGNKIRIKPTDPVWFKCKKKRTTKVSNKVQSRERDPDTNLCTDRQRSNKLKKRTCVSLCMSTYEKWRTVRGSQRRQSIKVIPSRKICQKINVPLHLGNINNFN